MHRRMLQRFRSITGADRAPIALSFLLSRSAFLLGATLGSLIIPEAIAEPARVDLGGPVVLSALWRWDAVHYHTIAVDGYAWPGLTAFSRPSRS